jgi:ParB/RepB/Spo0J family partition protein
MIRTIRIEQIHAHRQARAHFTEVTTLAESIAALGQLSPLIVREVSAQHYDLIAGERRLRALRLLAERDPAKWTCAECRVLPVNSDPTVELLIQLAENEQRAPLHPWERGAGYLAAHELGAPWSLIADRCAQTIGAVKRDALTAKRLHPNAIAALQKLPRDTFTASKLAEIASQLDELGRPDADRQLAWIRNRPRNPPRGLYDRALERRVVAAKLHALEGDLLPRLDPHERRIALAIINYLRRPGPVRAFRWEDFDK